MATEIFQHKKSHLRAALHNFRAFDISRGGDHKFNKNTSSTHSNLKWKMPFSKKKHRFGAGNVLIRTLTLVAVDLTYRPYMLE